MNSKSENNDCVDFMEAYEQSQSSIERILLQVIDRYFDYPNGFRDLIKSKMSMITDSDIYFGLEKASLRIVQLDRDNPEYVAVVSMIIDSNDINIYCPLFSESNQKNKKAFISVNGEKYFISDRAPGRAEYVSKILQEARDLLDSLHNADIQNDRKKIDLDLKPVMGAIKEVNKYMRQVLEYEVSVDSDGDDKDDENMMI